MSTILKFTLLLLLASLAASPGTRAQQSAAVADKSAVAAPASIDRLGEEACQALTQFYAYDRTIPLEGRVVEKTEQDDLVREKIVFRGVQGHLVPGYLQLPVTGAAPYPCVLLLHGWSGSKENWWQNDNYIHGGNVRQALLAAGIAICALDAQCHGDRIATNDFAPVNHYQDQSAAADPRKGYLTQPEIYIQTTRDYRRAIDYLESRKEINSLRIGALGYSMGGTQTFLLTGVEPRIKAAVAVATPADKSKWSITAPQNFVLGIAGRPFLTLIGTSDELCPLEHAQALQELIPSPTKEQQLFDAGHKLPGDFVPPAVGWLKKHL